MVQQILTSGQLEKIIIEKLIASFLTLKDNILLQQNDLSQQGHVEVTVKTKS